MARAGRPGQCNKLAANQDTPKVFVVQSGPTNSLFCYASTRLSHLHFFQLLVPVPQQALKQNPNQLPQVVKGEQKTISGSLSTHMVPSAQIKQRARVGGDRKEKTRCLNVTALLPENSNFGLSFWFTRGKLGHCSRQAVLMYSCRQQQSAGALVNFSLVMLDSVVALWQGGPNQAGRSG